MNKDESSEVYGVVIGSVVVACLVVILVAGTAVLVRWMVGL